jgi:hypothetical protein
MNEIFGMGLVGCLFFLCVVVMALVMEQDWLAMDIKNMSSKS